MNTKPTVILVEDDADFRGMIADELSSFYDIKQYGTAKAALPALGQPDASVIVLDVSLPDQSGISLCRQIRLAGVKTPVIMLSGDLEVTTKVSALETGADDYLTKPCHVSELRARIEVQRRRSDVAAKAGDRLTYGDLAIDLSTRKAWYRDQPLNLRRKEYDVLEALVLNRDHVVSRDQILELAWDSNVDLFTNSVDVHISKLRQKIDRRFGVTLIETVYGFGYRLLLTLGSNEPVTSIGGPHGKHA